MICEGNILLDTNIFLYLDIDNNCKNDRLIDLKQRSMSAILKLLPQTKLHHNLTIFKEIAVGVSSQDEASAIISLTRSSLKIENKSIMYDAAQSYRQFLNDFQEIRKNTEELIYKSKIIPNDCVIGATAQYYNLAIMTNNIKDFKKYFPEVEIIEI